MDDATAKVTILAGLATTGSLLVSTVLAFITWKYTKLTETIAIESARAASASRDAAQASLVQGIANLQPLLTILLMEVTLVPTRVGVQVPAFIKLSVRNLGPGTAFGPKVVVRVGSEDLISAAERTPLSLSPGDQMSVEFLLDEDRRGAAAASLGESNSVGWVSMSCHDALDSVVEIAASLLRSGDTLRLGVSERRHEGFSGGIRKLVHDLAERLSTPP